MRPSFGQLLHNLLQQNANNPNVVLEPGLAESLFSSLRESVRTVEEQGYPAVLVVSPQIRLWLARAVRHRTNDLTVLSYSEIPDEQEVKVVQTIQIQNRDKA